MSALRRHGAVGVDEGGLGRGADDVVHDGAAAGDHPQGAALGEAWQEFEGAVVEAQQAAGVVEFFVCLPEDDLGLDVADEAGGDLGGGGAVVGSGRADPTVGG